MSDSLTSWYLLNLRLFERVPPPQLERLRSASRVSEHAARHQIDLSTSPDTVHIIADGAAKLCRSGFLGRKIIDGLLQPGDVFGSVLAPPGRANRCFLETLDRTRILEIDRATFSRILLDTPQLAYNVTQVLEKRERQLERRVEALAFKDVRTRVIETLLELVREHGDKCEHGWAVDVRVTQQDIADLVGASRQIVSRILRELEFKFYLSRKGRVICILSLKRLSRLCGEAAGAVPVP